MRMRRLVYLSLVMLVSMLVLLGASGGAVSASHDPAYPSESNVACFLGTALATPGLLSAIFSVGFCQINTATVTTSVETARGFNVTVEYTAGQITYRTLSDGSHQFSDTRVATVLACVNPGGTTLTPQATAKNPNCAYSPGS